MVAVHQPVSSQGNIIQGNFENRENEKLLTQVETDAKRLGQVYWMEDNRHKALGFPRGLNTHPGLMPYELLVEIENHVKQILNLPLDKKADEETLQAKMKQLDSKSIAELIEWIGFRFDDYFKTGLIDYKNYAAAKSLFDNDEWMEKYAADWIIEITYKWSHANDNWAKIANMLINYASLDLKELSEGNVDDNLIHTLKKLSIEMRSIKDVKDILKIVEIIENDSILQRIMVEAHRGWRESRFPSTSEVELGFVKNLGDTKEVSNEAISGKLLRMDIYLNKLKNSPEIPSISLTNKIIELRRELETDPSIPAYDTFNFMILIAKKVAVFSEEISHLRDKTSDTMIKSKYSYILRQVGAALDDYLIWDLKQDANPAIPDAIMNLIKSH